MARTSLELSSDISDDFKEVVGKLRDRFVGMATSFHGRATHSTGIAARGEAQIVIPPDFPISQFLEFGKRYPIIVRHASARPIIGGNTDDRTLDGASMSVKFLKDENDPDGFHDILMNAGRALFVPSARAFLRLISTPNEERLQLVRDGQLDYELLTENYRCGLFNEYYYHSQIAFEFTDSNGVMRYLKFRAIPADRGPERGKMPLYFQAEGFTFKPAWQDDGRASDFRRKDFETRVRHLSVGYLLQAQIRTSQDRNVLSPMQYWDDSMYPWCDVAYLRLTQVLNAEEMHLLNFHVNRTDEAINIALAPTADDPASIGHARALVYTDAWLARKNSPSPHVV